MIFYKFRNDSVRISLLKVRYILTFIFLAGFFLMSRAQTPDGNNILYVNINISGGNGSGNSWSNAIPQLADALLYARQQNNYTNDNPLKIYVAKGTYNPLYSAAYDAYTADGGRENSFVMIKNVQIYGGFDPLNGITDLDDPRIFGNNGSILSGDVGNSGVDSNYVFHVLIAGGDLDSAKVDGFTISYGNADTETGTIISLNPFVFATNALGGGIVFENTKPTISNVIISDNKATLGGGISNRDSWPTLTNVTISNNTANAGGGGGYIFASSPIFNNTVISNNSAIVGGGIMVQGSGTISNVTISGNSSEFFGGGINMVNDGYLIINNSVINGNTGVGGGLYNPNGDITLNNVTFSNNKSSTYGGAILNTGTITMNGGEMAGNSASAGGGAIYNTSTVTLNNVSVYADTSSLGGAILNIASLMVNGGSFFDNIGSAIFNSGAEGILNGVDFHNNISSNGGALVNINSNIDMTDVNIWGNSAFQNGGGIYNNSSNLTMKDVTISDNISGIGGGICDVGNTTHTLERVIIKGNAGNIAGGIAGLGSSTITGTDILFSGNITVSNDGIPFPNGSAITLSNASSVISLINATVVDNNGGMDNNSISTQGSLSLVNSIVFGNMASGTHQYNYSLMEGNTDTSNGNIDASGITPADLFSDSFGGNYTLKPGSPAIDKGLNSLYPNLDASSTDLAGNARVFDYSNSGIIDLGAYESPYRGTSHDAFGIVYVKSSATGLKNGSSWEDATDDLQSAINTFGAIRVYVAKGTYPVASSSFIMKQNVGIYGGFDPDNNIRTLDDKRIAPTLTTGSILDGANTRPVIWNVNNGLTSSATLDGFTLTNAAGVNQGSIYNDGASPRLRNLFIAGNNTSGIYNLNASPSLTNVCINGNSARGIYHHGGNPTLLNTTIAGNTGEAAVVITGSITSNNSLICGTINGAVTNNYSLFTTDIPTINSLFVDYAGGDYSLKYNSPAVDAGSNSLYSGLSPETRDLASNPRLFGTNIDMGAYEFNLLHDANNIAYVSTTGAGKHDGSSWEHATTNLQGAINSTGTAQVFVAKGIYTVGGNSYIMKDGVEIYGGFDPGNNIRTLDDDRIAPTLTTGSILNGNNARPVIWNVNNGVTASAILDGFTLTNAAGNNQGAIYNTGTSPTLRNLLITTNNTNGVYNTNASPTLINVCLSNNGIAMYQNGGTASLINTTIAGNTTAANIVSGGITAKNSLVCGTVSGSMTNNTSVITADAGIINSIFADYGGGDYSLKYAGPAANTGNNSLFPGLSAQTKDLAGNARLFGTNIDLGAYEFNILHDVNNIVYVSTTGAGRHDGSSWEHATSSLQGAINTPGATKVFVAKGTYTVGGDSYIMKDGVEIYGGFDPDINIRTLDDDRIAPSTTAGSVLNGNNTRPVIWNVNNGVTASAVLDGFTLTNAAGNNQGSVYNTGTSPTLRNLLITTNNTNGVYNTNASPTLINVCLSSNSTAMYQNGGTASLINTTIAGNTTAANIASGGITANNSLVCGTVSGSMTNNTSVITADAGIMNSLFADYAGGDYSLSYDSPAINAGDNSLFPGLSAQTKDLAGSPRLFGTNIDMGAYESGLSADNFGIIYVKTIGVGVKNGSSWENATNDLHAALIAKSVQKIFVAKGTYSVGGASYTMKNNLEIYGGFDPENNIRTLDDDRILPSETESGSVLDGQGTKQVIVNLFTAGTALDTSAVLDGFTVSGGYTSSNGGGMYNEYASPLLRHVVFQSNSTGAIRYGGGMYNSNSSPVLRQCSFLSNSAGYGGGVYNTTSAPTFENCLFKNNNSNIAAGALYNTGSTTIITNTRFISNTSSTYTAAIHAASGDLTMINCLFSGNQAPLNSTGAIHLPGGTNTFINVTMADNGDYGISGTALYSLKNSIIWDDIQGNYDADHCMIKNKSDETNGNLDATAYTAADIFMDPTTGNYALKSTSPVIDQGDNSLFPGLNGSTKDLAGNLRLLGTKIDMGAFEFGTPLPVKLLSFTVQKQGEKAVLIWRTATEQNNHGFEIQRSTDGKYWTALTFIYSKADGGNSLSPLQYSYSDNTPAKAVNYYRLKQIDRNGSYEYSVIRSVSYDGGRAINVYPNPATVQVTVTGLQKDDQITLVDGLGNKVRQFESEDEKMTVMMSQLQRGIYYIVVTNGDRAVATFKVVKGE